MSLVPRRRDVECSTRRILKGVGSGKNLAASFDSRSRLVISIIARFSMQYHQSDPAFFLSAVQIKS